MNKIIELSRRIISFLLAVIFLLLVGFFVFQNYLRNFLPLPVFVEIKRFYIYFLAIGFFILIPILPTSKYPITARMVLLMLVIPLFCLFSYKSIDLPEQIQTSAELGNHRYYITVEEELEPRVIYSTYRCSLDDLECELIFRESHVELDDVSLIADEKMNELHVLRKGRLRYTDGEQARMILENEEYGGFIYSVATPPVDVYYIYGSSSREYTYMLYKCKISFTECQKLPFHYTDNGGSFRLTFNANTNELEISHWRSDMDETLIYSYGIEPKCYVEQCVIPNE